MIGVVEGEIYICGLRIDTRCHKCKRCCMYCDIVCDDRCLNIPEKCGQLTDKKCRVDLKKLQEMYDKGYTDRQISEKIGQSQELVRYWRKRLGLKSNRKMSIEKAKQKVKSLSAQGLDAKEIAEKVGITRQTVLRWEKEG